MELSACRAAGLTEPAKQYSLYADFSASKGLIDETLRAYINAARSLHAAGRACASWACVLVHSTDGVACQQIYPVCGFLIRSCNSLSFSPLCYFALLVCQQTVVGPIQLAAGNFNVYVPSPCMHLPAQPLLSTVSSAPARHAHNQPGTLYAGMTFARCACRAASSRFLRPAPLLALACEAQLTERASSACHCAVKSQT